MKLTEQNNFPQSHQLLWRIIKSFFFWTKSKCQRRHNLNITHDKLAFPVPFLCLPLHIHKHNKNNRLLLDPNAGCQKDNKCERRYSNVMADEPGLASCPIIFVFHLSEPMHFHHLTLAWLTHIDVHRTDHRGGHLLKWLHHWHALDDDGMHHHGTIKNFLSLTWSQQIFLRPFLASSTSVIVQCIIFTLHIIKPSQSTLLTHHTVYTDSDSDKGQGLVSPIGWDHVQSVPTKPIPTIL